jgi:hypothetical protein
LFGANLDRPFGGDRVEAAKIQRDARRRAPPANMFCHHRSAWWLAIRRVPSFTLICIRRKLPSRAFDGDRFGAVLDQRHVREALYDELPERWKRVLFHSASLPVVESFQKS